MQILPQEWEHIALVILQSLHYQLYSATLKTVKYNAVSIRHAKRNRAVLMMQPVMGSLDVHFQKNAFVIFAIDRKYVMTLAE